ncbi:MAG TPA: hypothetical protein VL463_19625 [Kofleriaceae bacterium]|jgi:hypothetical protein|nr:hypothetical protein [Kofleriaceae bacterium]
MMYRSTVLIALFVCACVGPSVEVTPLHPAPHALAPRTPEQVTTFPAAPDDGVAVYRIEVSGGSQSELETALKTKAASLGCDGVVITLAPTQAHTSGETQTGALNDHRTVEAARVSALCIVVPAKASTTATAP